MKKSIIIQCLIAFLAVQAYAQGLTGTKTIPGDYLNFSAAFKALNDSGVGNGGVMFHVLADSVIYDNPPPLTVLGTASSPVVFKKYGSGANPIIIPADTGVLHTNNNSVFGDALIRVAGSEYVTFDGIDIRENSLHSSDYELLESGFLLLRNAASNRSCRNIAIQNCKIQLKYGYHNASGIVLTNYDNTNGINSYTGYLGNDSIFLSGNTIDSTYNGIQHLSLPNLPYSLYEGFFKISGNTVSNFGGGAKEAVGIAIGCYIDSTVIEKNILVSSSQISDTLTGISVGEARNSNVLIVDNELALMGKLTAAIFINSGPFSYDARNSVVVSRNKLSKCSGEGSLIYIAKSPNLVIVEQNKIDSSLNINYKPSHFINISGNPKNTLIRSNSFLNSSIKAGGSAVLCMGSTLTDYYYELMLDSNYFSGLVSSGSIISIHGYSNSLITVEKNEVVDVIGESIINVAGKSTTRISRNLIHRVSAPSIVNIYTSDITIDNNILYELEGISDAKTFSVFSATSSFKNIKLYYNTVYLDAFLNSSGAINSTIVNDVTVQSEWDIRNNIFINLSSKGIGGKRSIFWGNSLKMPLNAETNSNCYYTGTPSSGNLIYYRSFAVKDSAIWQFQQRQYPLEQSSFGELPPFVNDTASPYNLNLINNTPTALESGGVAVHGINIDFYGNQRDTLSPDIGAQEGNYPGKDVLPPLIKFSGITHSGIVESSRDINAVVITDPSGVDTTVVNRPRIYFRKTSNQNIYTGNDSINDGWKWTKAVVVNDTTFNFLIDYHLLDSMVQPEDTVEFFFVARDLSAGNNISVNGTFLSASADSVEIASASFPALNSIYSYKIKNGVSGVVSVGINGDFPNLTGTNGLFAHLNNSVMSGSLTAKIISDIEEPGTVSLEGLDKYNDRSFWVRIIPDTSVLYKIIGANYGGLIKIGSGEEFIIDGSYNGFGRYLHFHAPKGIGGHVIGIYTTDINPYYAYTKNVVIQNCIISSSSDANKKTGINIGSGSLNNIQQVVIDNNWIYNVGSGGVGITSSEFYANKNIYIKNNLIGKFEGITFSRGIACMKVDSLIIFNNVIEGVHGSGIYISAVKNVKIISNKISTAEWKISPENGIYVNYAKADIINNHVSVNFKNETVAPLKRTIINGVRIEGSDHVKFYHNSIHLAGNTNNEVSSAAFSINVSPYGARNVDIQNNIFSNLMEGTGSYYGLASARVDSFFTGLDHNIYHVSPVGFAAIAGVWPVKSGNHLDSISKIHHKNSFACDPLFYSDDDLRVMSSCISDSGGSSVGVVTDIFGMERDSANPTIGAHEFKEYINDLSVGDIIPGPKCVKDSIKFRVVVVNPGKASQNGFDISFEVSGDSVYNSKVFYADTLAPKSLDTIEILLSTTDATTDFHLKVWVDLNGDQFHQNDSQLKYFSFHSSPPTPLGIDDSICFGEIATLFVHADSGISHKWYSHPADTMVLFSGDTLKIDSLTKNEFFYVISENKYGCTSHMDTVMAFVYPEIVNGEIRPDTAFEGILHLGNSSDPDQSCLGQVLVYEFVPPDNYSNSDYGKSWLWDSAFFLNIEPDSFSFNFPDTASNAKLTVFTQQADTGKTFEINATFRALAGNCTKLFTRSFRVSDLPYSGFGYANNCKKDTVWFWPASWYKEVSYLWNFGDTVQISTEYAGHYTTTDTLIASLTITAANGCKSTSYDTLPILAKPVASFKLTSDCENSGAQILNTSTISSGSIMGIRWSIGDSMGVTTQPAIALDTPGIYTVQMLVFSDSGCTDYLWDTVIIHANEVCVWPGDANNDGVANNKDILAIGAKTNQIGPARDTVSIEWRGNRASDWSDTISYGINLKHTDCNGDGIISTSDTAAVALNYGSIHNKKSFLMKAGPEDPVFSVKIQNKELIPGTVINADILLGSLQVPADSIYGLAYTITMSEGFIEPNSTELNYNGNWLAINSGETIELTKIFDEGSEVQTAVCRTDQINRSGSGKIAEMRFKFKDTLPGDPSTITFKINLQDVLIVDANLTPVKYNVQNDSITTIEEERNIDLKIFPNPANNELFIEWTDLEVERIRIIDLKGKVLWIQESPADKTAVDILNFSSGLYIVELQHSAGVIQKKVVVVKQ